MKTFSPVPRVKVILDVEGTQRPMGALAWSTAERRAYFEYAPEFPVSGLLVSPFHLPLRLGAQPARQDLFEGLHGVFNDSLPDGWGRLLLDRRLQQHGIDYQSLTPLDRLAAVGQTGMGSLRFVPELEKPADLDPHVDLDWFEEEVGKTQTELSVDNIDTLQGAQGGSSGARPKIMVGLSADRKSLIIDYGQPMPEGYDQWIVKFRSRADPTEIGAEEYAYALMAKDAGIDMAETRLLETRKGARLFATKRFDRTDLGRLHMHTIGGLINADHRIPSLDYRDIIKATLMMTRDQAEVLRMFRRMIFNVLAYNRDDHAKNHAFLMDGSGTWKLSPAYDLTFSTGPGGEHSTTVAGQGRSPTEKDILDIAKEASIDGRTAKGEIDRVRSAIDNWRIHAAGAGLSHQRAAELDLRLNPARKTNSIGG